MPQHPIVIVGAGIGGLCAAHALLKRQHAVRILERASSLQAAGAGIVLSTNAMRALAGLDLDAAVRAAGVPLHCVQLRRKDGVVMQEVHLDRMGERFGQHGVGIHRSALQQVLAAPFLNTVETQNVETQNTLLLNAAVNSFSQDTAGVVVHLQTQNDISANLLVGADGLRSKVRTTLWGDSVPRYAGYTCWRGVAQSNAVATGTSMESWGRGLRFGAVTVGPQQVYWFAVSNAPPGRVQSGEAGHAEVARLFCDWHAPISELIASTPPDSVLHNDIFDRPPIFPWGRDDVTLLGDAAHPTTPNMGQGAGMAIEDAVVLAASVAQHGGTPKALRAYEAQRHERTAQVVQSSWSMGRLAQASHPGICAMRNLAVRATPTWVAARQMQRLFAFDPPG